jgi:hypothetical protein
VALLAPFFTLGKQVEWGWVELLDGAWLTVQIPQPLLDVGYLIQIKFEIHRLIE